MFVFHYWQLESVNCFDLTLKRQKEKKNHRQWTLMNQSHRKEVQDAERLSEQTWLETATQLQKVQKFKLVTAIKQKTSKIDFVILYELIPLVIIKGSGQWIKKTPSQTLYMQKISKQEKYLYILGGKTVLSPCCGSHVHPIQLLVFSWRGSSQKAKLVANFNSMKLVQRWVGS